MLRATTNNFYKGAKVKVRMMVNPSFLPREDFKRNLCFGLSSVLRRFSKFPFENPKEHWGTQSSPLCESSGVTAGQMEEARVLIPRLNFTYESTGGIKVSGLPKNTWLISDAGEGTDTILRIYWNLSHTPAGRQTAITFPKSNLGNLVQ